VATVTRASGNCFFASTTEGWPLIVTERESPIMGKRDRGVSIADAKAWMPMEGGTKAPKTSKRGGSLKESMVAFSSNFRG
jgi:hypothetical protein